MNTQRLFGTDPVLWNKISMIVRFCAPRQVLSTSPLNGGYREDLTALFHYDETREETPICTMRAETYEEHAALIAEELGLNRHTVAGLTTAAHMRNAVCEEEVCGGVNVTAIVTAGVDRNGVRVGEPTQWDERETQQHVAGTVNVFLAIDAHLKESALVRAVITATEAKTAALQELLAPSLWTTGLATGTGTDGIAVIANPQSKIFLTDAGTHSKLGEGIGKAVKRAVKKALFLQTGLCEQSQHDVQKRLGRFGVTEQNALTQCGISAEGFRACVQKLSARPNVVAEVSLLAHLLDEAAWGLLSESEVAKTAQEIFGRLGHPCTLSAEKATDAIRNECFLWMAEEAENANNDKENGKRQAK